MFCNALDEMSGICGGKYRQSTEHIESCRLQGLQRLFSGRRPPIPDKSVKYPPYVRSIPGVLCAQTSSHPPGFVHTDVLTSAAFAGAWDGPCKAVP